MGVLHLLPHLHWGSMHDCLPALTDECGRLTVLGSLCLPFSSWLSVSWPIRCMHLIGLQINPSVFATPGCMRPRPCTGGSSLLGKHFTSLLAGAAGRTGAPVGLVGSYHLFWDKASPTWTARQLELEQESVWKLSALAGGEGGVEPRIILAIVLAMR
jgi:hypothetical protein